MSDSGWAGSQKDLHPIQLKTNSVKQHNENWDEEGPLKHCGHPILPVISFSSSC